jgi:hypothetical protein
MDEQRMSRLANKTVQVPFGAPARGRGGALGSDELQAKFAYGRQFPIRVFSQCEQWC